MKVSIVTICRNCEETIEATIQSVLSQTYGDIEYVIVDGNSTDSTLEIVAKYEARLSKVLYKCDAGIYDSINRGIEACSGEVIGVIHGGDSLYDKEVISKLIKVMRTSKADVVYGNSIVVSNENKVVRVNKSPKYEYNLLNKGWMPSHQSIYVRRKAMERVGLYRTDIGLIADYEWFVRLVHVPKLTIVASHQLVLRFLAGGVSTKNYSHKLFSKHGDSLRLSWTINGISPPAYLHLKMLLRKPKQFLKAFFYVS